MDPSSNGHGKRPFGPHGEGCTCEPETNDEQTETPEEPAAEHEGPRTLVISQESNLHEIVWAAASEATAGQVLSAIATCESDREPLTYRQQTHIVAGALRGFALSKETAAIIEGNYYARMMRATEPRPATEEEPEPKLRSVTDLFNGTEPSGD